MEKETIIFTALPNGRDPVDGALRLSIYISPRLWTDDPVLKKLTLAQFPDFLDWTTRIAAATWPVSFDGAPPVPTMVESVAPRADLWSALFKTETDVLPFQFDDHRGTLIETSPSDKIHDFLTGVYVRAGSDLNYGQGRDLPTVETLAADPDLSEIARPSQPEAPVISTPSHDPIDLHGTMPPLYPEPVPAPGEPPRGCGCCGCGCLLWPFAFLARLFPFLDPIFARIFGSAADGTSGPAKSADPPAYPSAPFPTPPPPAPPNPPPVEPAGEVMPPWTVPLTAKQEIFTKLSAFVMPWSEVSAPLPTAEELKEIYDFHQMMASLGDYPKLLRILGLVVDLRIPPGGGAPPAGGTIQVSPGIALSPAGKIITPRTHYEITPDGFRAQPRPVEAEISNGFLRLNDTTRFQVMQVDTVGAGIKVQNMATNFRAFATKKRRSPNMPDNAGLPALRSGGISVVRRNLVADLEATFARSHALHLAVAAIDAFPLPPPPPGAGVALPPSDELFAEDLVRGYRIDVFDSKSKTWHSLCQRLGTYDFLEAAGGKLSLDLEDEGFVQFGATKPTTPPPQPILKTSDQLFVWDGWSLCAPRPGKSIMPDAKDAVPDAKGEIPVRLEKPKNEAVTKFKLETAFRAKPGTLPRFRFDYTYRLRARVCDLAGNSVRHPDTPADPDPDFKKDVAEQTADFACARFEPVAPPAMMLRARPLEGESLERLVVRSPAITPNDNITERHIVPPKVSQLMTEQHGRFDLANKMNAAQSGYDLAAKEAGALEDFATQVFVSDPLPGETEPSKVWVQTADQFPLTYLPDPCSRGAILFGLTGDIGEVIVEPGVKIVNKIPFDDPPATDLWPDRLPFRLRVVAVKRGTPPSDPVWSADRVLTVKLPEAEKRIVKLSSYFTSEDLKRQGVWQWMEANAPAELAKIKADTIAGRSWLHLPWREITLIHPVLTPLDKPAVVDPLQAAKNLGETAATITGDVQCDAASTGKVDVFAAWSDPVDDLKQPGPTTRPQRAHLCEVFVPEGADETALIDSVKAKPTVHHFGDTKFHAVNYTPIATTRFREYFPRSVTDDHPENVTLPGTPSAPVKILNSARPDAPKVLYVVPTFGWEPPIDAGNTTKRVRKGGGLRVYLDRPWYSSGEGELLGVVFRENEKFTSLAEELKPLVTQWGADPIWSSDAAIEGFARQKHFHGASAAGTANLAELAQPVSVVGYEPEFDPVRRLWFADLVLDLGSSYTPFVRLALVRFQPNSLKDAEISRVVRAEFARLAPDRTASITTTPSGAGATKFTIVVTGPTYIDSSATFVASHIGKESGHTGRAEIEALLQKRDPTLGTDPDLAWKTISSTELTTKPESIGTWEGEVDLTDPLTPNTYRLLLQEYEWYRSDHQPENAREGATMARRIVYADAVALG